MWLLLLITLLNPSIQNTSAIETSNGPASAEEAALLWKDGRDAFDNGKYQDALNDLQRLVDRYPGSEGYLEAHRYLGRALMMLGKNEEAISPLRYYVDATGNRELGLRTKLWLGENDLILKKPAEAYLLSQEIEKGSASAAPELHAESQFLKARSLTALGRDTDALRVLDSVENTPAVQSDPTLKGHAAHAHIILKLKSCARLPSQGRMDESQARDQFIRRGTCLQEALVMFKDTTQSREALTGDDAADKIYQAFLAYSSAVQNPPAPIPLKPVDRTDAQKKSYSSELSDRLRLDLKKTIHESLANLEEWRKTSTSSAKAKTSEAFSKLSKKIETLL